METEEEPYYYKFERIKTRLSKNKHTLDCGKSGEDVNIHKILGDIFVEKENGVHINGINLYGGSLSIADEIGQIDYGKK